MRTGTGIDAQKLDELLARARRDVDEGPLPSCQLALARDGRIVASAVFGDADPSTRYVIFSATKAVVASAVWQLLAEGTVRLEQPVAEIVGEFGTNGKDAVTVEQVMLHTSGFPQAPMPPSAWLDREARLERFSAWRLNWEPGTRYEYHPTSAHWVLAEIIERADGRDFRESIRERVTLPLGLPRLRVGVPPEEQGDIAELRLVGEPPSPDELEAAIGIRELPVTEVTDEALLYFNDADARAAGVPGGGGVACASDLAMFYQALLRDERGLWDREVLADATGRVRTMLPDPLLGVPASRGLGLVIAGDDGLAPMRGFGKTVSPRAFGHNGAAGQIAWADPETGLSFCYLTNGRDRGVLREWRRTVALASRAAVCASP